MAVRHRPIWREELGTRNSVAFGLEDEDYIGPPWIDTVSRTQGGLEDRPDLATPVDIKHALSNRASCRGVQARNDR